MGDLTELLFMVLLVSGLGHTQRIKRDETPHCWNPEEMESQVKGLQKLLGRARMNQLPSVTLVKELEQQKPQGKKGCPDLRQYSTHSRDISHRSISPWAYRIDYDENRYPPKLALADCLCDGCIDAENGEEMLWLNSVPVEQTMLVLQRQTCPGHPGMYSFHLKYIKVPVGCTCVLPKNSW
ncbi:interleukin-17C-like [Hemiscyllium ocellatum]|uniref:interleukin-17C-like n=1 Tax=Hemiscyllium ocellatum TaxID=170820 RepID=UPI00296600CC|nr:interleukin-17C-like [Hemiscyllium ocellatum]